MSPSGSPLRIIRTDDERLDDNHALLVGNGRNSPENRSHFCRRDPENLLVQLLVIFPRVHVARNVGRFNRHALHLFSMRIEQRAQTSLRIERQQFITVNEIDYHRMTTAAVVFRLNESSVSMSPFVYQLSNGFTGNRGLIDQRDEDSFCLRADSDRKSVV